MSKWSLSLLGTPKTCHGGLVAKAEAHAVTSLMPLLLKFVKNLYKTRQTDTVRICFKNFFSWEHETLVDGCLQKENFFHTSETEGRSFCI